MEKENKNVETNNDPIKNDNKKKNNTNTILIVVIVNAIIGVTQEAKAEKSLEALQKLTDHASKVIRNGNVQVIPAKELVPGDIVLLDTGDYIPADLRIIEAINLKSQESSLTGESVPVEKNTKVIEDEETGIGDRINMLFSFSFASLFTSLVFSLFSVSFSTSCVFCFSPLI